MSDYITRLINGKQVQLATLMTGACFLADNSILMKRSFLWDLLERVTERCVLTFSRWLEARVIISCTGGDTNEETLVRFRGIGIPNF